MPVVRCARRAAVILITGGIEEDSDRYWRRHQIGPGGGWYYRSGPTALEATRLILEAVAPHHHPEPWLTRSLTTAKGPLDWPT